MDQGIIEISVGVDTHMISLVSGSEFSKPKLLVSIFLTRQLTELKVKIEGMTFLLDFASSGGWVASQVPVMVFTRRRARSMTVRG